MKNILLYILFLLLTSANFAQLQQAALYGEKITSFAMITIEGQTEILAGTESNGFYSHFINEPDTGWHHGWFNNRSVSTLFVQKIAHEKTTLSRIFFGMGSHSSDDSTLIYTNDAPVQSAIIRRDSGINVNNNNKIISFAGFNYSGSESVMPAFCLDEFSSVYKLVNMGWHKINSISPGNTLNVIHASDLILWAGGTNGDFVSLSVILKSSDYGETWQEFFPSTGWGCFSITSFPGDTATVYAGLNDAVIKSSDGGYTWETVLTDSGVIFTSIVINSENPDNIFAGGKRNNEAFVLYRTDDNGITWEYIDHGMDCDCVISGINTMLLINDEEKLQLFIGTDRDGVLKYEENVVSVIDESNLATPEKFELYQNYPNPFNPVTNLEFRIPARRAGEADFGFIRLKIYDILGKEVAVLVNEERAPGTYKISFDASNLSSGVYYYTLIAGDKVLTKKMVLLR